MHSDYRNPSKQTYAVRPVSFNENNYKQNPQHTIYSLMEHQHSTLPEIRLHTGDVLKEREKSYHETLPKYLGVGEGDFDSMNEKSMKAQASCESYDSATSGMSWSSSQSVITNHNRNDDYAQSSVSTHLSYTDQQPEDGGKIKGMNCMPTLFRTSSKSLREHHSKGTVFTTGASVDETEANICDVESTNSSEKFTQTSNDLYNFSSNKTEVENTSNVEETTPKNFKMFWKRALKAIRASKKTEFQEPQDEVDPVYELLKFAANSRTNPAPEAITSKLRSTDTQYHSESHSDSASSNGGGKTTKPVKKA